MDVIASQRLLSPAAAACREELKASSHWQFCWQWATANLPLPSRGFPLRCYCTMKKPFGRFTATHLDTAQATLLNCRSISMPSRARGETVAETKGRNRAGTRARLKHLILVSC